MAQNTQKKKLAYMAMQELGLEKAIVAPILAELLQVYNQEWSYIEAENYRLLADQAFEQQEVALSKKEAQVATKGAATRGKRSSTETTESPTKSSNSSGLFCNGGDEAGPFPRGESLAEENGSNPPISCSDKGKRPLGSSGGDRRCPDARRPPQQRAHPKPNAELGKTLPKPPLLATVKLEPGLDVAHTDTACERGDIRPIPTKVSVCKEPTAPKQISDVEEMEQENTPPPPPPPPPRPPRASVKAELYIAESSVQLQNPSTQRACASARISPVTPETAAGIGAPATAQSRKEVEAGSKSPSSNDEEFWAIPKREVQSEPATVPQSPGVGAPDLIQTSPAADSVQAPDAGPLGSEKEEDKPKEEADNPLLFLSQIYSDDEEDIPQPVVGDAAADSCDLVLEVMDEEESPSLQVVPVHVVQPNSEGIRPRFILGSQMLPKLTHHEDLKNAAVGSTGLEVVAIPTPSKRELPYADEDMTSKRLKCETEPEAGPLLSGGCSQMVDANYSQGEGEKCGAPSAPAFANSLTTGVRRRLIVVDSQSQSLSPTMKPSSSVNITAPKSYNMITPEALVAAIETAQAVAKMSEPRGEVACKRNEGVASETKATKLSKERALVACTHAEVVVPEITATPPQATSILMKRVKIEPGLEGSDAPAAPPQLKKKRRHDPEDISRGTENVPIPFVNEYTSEKIPRSFKYIRENTVFEKAHVIFSLARVGEEDCCTKCAGNCLKARFPCECTRETGGEFAYTSEGLLKEEYILPEVARMQDPDSDARLLSFCPSGWECPTETIKVDGNPASCRGHVTRNFLKECWHKCGCSMECGNRVVQRGIHRQLQIFFTQEGKGWGLRTMEDLPAGAFVCEYVGEIMTNIELDKRNQENLHNASGEHTYPILLDGDWCSESGLQDEEALCLDATYFGNAARFINHRCFDANLIDLPVTIESPDRHYYHVAFFTGRPVKAMEELTWDYKIDFEDKDHPIEAFQCLCGSHFCRGVSGKRKHK